MGQALLISIIIGNYNYGRFLKEAIGSALSQTYRPIEVIVVDDGSTDNSREVIAGYGERVTAILKQNGGQASALNAGFARSRGEIVIFLDSDDVLRPGIAEEVAEVFRANAEVAKIMYRMEVIDEAGRHTGTLKPAPHLPIRSGDLRRYVLAFPFDMTWMPTSGNAFSARILRQIFPIPEQAYGRVGADWYVSHLSPLFGPVVFLDEIGADYRVHGGNSYELLVPKIDLDHIRQTIAYSDHTYVYISKFADQLGLDVSAGQRREQLSVSSLADRITSLKLAPGEHPLQGDRVWRLLLLGMRASLRRFDVSWPMRLLLLLWFVAMAPAPAPIARWLAEAFAFPEKRGHINDILRILHR